MGTTLSEILKYCLELPGSVEPNEQGRFAVGVIVKGKHKGYVWTWAERIDPKKPKVENRGVIAVRVPSLSVKEGILSGDHPAFFTEDHYNGYPAVLVKLDQISLVELEPFLDEAWKTLVPDSVAKAHLNPDDSV